MKILFLDTYYPKAIRNFRRQYPDYSKFSYKQYKKQLLSTCFGTADFYSNSLNKLGCQATDFVVNDKVMQKKWAEENNIEVKDNWVISMIQSIPYMNLLLGNPKWTQQISLEQIKTFKPDVVYMQNLSVLGIDTLDEVKKECKLLVGQIASPLPSYKYLKKFDLIISSFPHYVKLFRKMNISSEYQKLSFEPRVLKKIGRQGRVYDVTFVGSFTPYHHKGTRLLEEVATQVPIHIWGQKIGFWSPFSPLRKNYHGEAWGLDMYKIFAKSKIVINRHIGVAGEYANNTRLFEATGMGAALITDNKKNLGELFEIGKEVVAYSDGKDLLNKIQYFLRHDKERQCVAKAGQKRTLTEYNYLKRMKELKKILNKYL